MEEGSDGLYQGPGSGLGVSAQPWERSRAGSIPCRGLCSGQAVGWGLLTMTPSSSRHPLPRRPGCRPPPTAGRASQPCAAPSPAQQARRVQPEGCVCPSMEERTRGAWVCKCAAWNPGALLGDPCL